MDKTAKIRMKAKRNVTDLAGEKVMVDFEQGKYFCIKGVGNDIWDMLDGQEGEDGKNRRGLVSPGHNSTYFDEETGDSETDGRI